MDIRKIHIDQFGVWQDVSIHSLTPSINVIHLADGGRPIDLARFLHETLFGTKSQQAHSGALLLAHGHRQWRLDRSSDGKGGQSFGVTDPDRPEIDYSTAFAERLSRSHAIFAEYFSIPTEELACETKWEWLSRHPAIARQLLADRLQADNDVLLGASHPLLSSPGILLEQLGEQRERLLDEIAGITLRVADAPPKLRVVPVSEIAVAELKDELRMLERQVAPLLVAIELAARWQEMLKLRQDVGIKTTPDQLKDWLSEYRMLEVEKADWLQILTSPRKPAKKKIADEQQVRRLLDQRDLVMSSFDRPSVVETLDFTDDSRDELRHAGFLLENAKREAEYAQRQLSEFVKRTGIDLSDLLVDEPTTEPSEISRNSGLAQEPPSIQLAELKRRRLWIREEHRYLVGQQEISTQTCVWLAILFTLSVASLFGTLLVVSTSAQWVLAAFGLGGIVSSGALKLSIELRASRQLNRATDRLRQIDGEILVLTEQVLNEQQDATTSRRRAEQKLHALQLQHDAIEAHNRRDGAELAFRELLDLCGLPVTLTPTEATRGQSHIESRQPEVSSGDGKFRRWIKRSRDLIQRIHGVRPGKNPLELIGTLELIYDQLRGGDHSNNDELFKETSRQERDEARRELKRVEKQQRLLLRRGRVEDHFELEAAVDNAEQQSKNRQRLRILELELSAVIESHEDREEIRELLEMYSVDELRLRLSERMHIQEETRKTLREQQAAQSAVSKPARMPITIAQQELDRARLRLSVVETRIRHVMRQAQAATVFRRVAHMLSNRQVQPHAFQILSELTNGRWSSIQLAGDGFFLKAADGTMSPVVDSNDAELAWLALQLNAAIQRAAGGESLPLVLLADKLFASPGAAIIYDVLRNACARGVQVLLLIGNHQLVNQLAEAGAPVVRVGLREQQRRPPRLARVLDQEMSETLPRLARF